MVYVRTKTPDPPKKPYRTVAQVFKKSRGSFSTHGVRTYTIRTVKHKNYPITKSKFHMKQRGKMKIPITLKIDHNKKMLFESTKQIHGKTFTDALDEVITEYLSDIVPADLLELKIQQTEEALKEMRENLIKARTTQQEAQIELNKGKADDPSILKFREKKFIDSKKSIITQIKNNSISWSTIMKVFMFDNKKETRAWILKKIEEST